MNKSNRQIYYILSMHIETNRTKTRQILLKTPFLTEKRSLLNRTFCIYIISSFVTDCWGFFFHITWRYIPRLWPIRFARRKLATIYENHVMHGVCFKNVWYSFEYVQNHLDRLQWQFLSTNNISSVSSNSLEI